MQWSRDLADRLGVSVWVVWAGLAGIAFAVYLVLRRARAGASSANASPDILNGPFSGGIDGISANPFPPSPNGGADNGVTGSATVPASGPTGIANPPPVRGRRVVTKTLPAAMTWPQIAQSYTGSSANAGWLLSWNAQLHSQPWWTVAKGTQINVPQ